MVGVGGALFTFIEIFVFEFSSYFSIDWTIPVILYLAGYVIFLVLMYVITAVLLYISTDLLAFP
jgi:hypothetical protein